jgi:two-component system sensor histidine kinase KdpD
MSVQVRIQALALRALARWRATRRGVRGTAAAALGVAVATLCIGSITRVVHVANISLLYLLVVLWLAAVYGRGPALLASALAFLAYDFFFIPPVHGLTVDDPAQWVSLGALLATALVLGQLTAAVQARAHEAQESQQRTATLYALAQLIVSASDEETILAALTQRVATIFAVDGAHVCLIAVPDAQGRLVTRAEAEREGASAGLSLENREQAAQADWVLHASAVAGGIVPGARTPSGEQAVAFYVPLRSGTRAVGVLGIAGTQGLRRLVAGLPAGSIKNMGEAGEAALHDPRVELFRAVCDQLALVVDRIALRQHAVHAEALRESDQLKNALLGSVTHDLRTPLAAIQAATSSLLEAGMQWGEAERREFLETIASSADRLSRLVSNLLDLSRLEAGAATPEMRWYPIGDVIATVLDRLDTARQTRQHRIDVAVDEDVPPTLMDHTQMEQVLTNLLENAIKYSPQGSTIRVHARRSTEPETLEVSVTDEGIGIPASELNAIFDKFYRVQHPRLPWAGQRPPAGTGLGLAICAGIVRAHGGRIWAESRPGEGATLTFTLPLTPELEHGALPDIGDDMAQVEAAPAGEVPATADDTTAVEHIAGEHETAHEAAGAGTP